MHQQSEPDALAALRNIEPRTARRMVAAGITSVTALRALGAVAAYRQLKHAAPRETTLVALYAIQGALMDCPWTELPTAMREELREAALTPD